MPDLHVSQDDRVLGVALLGQLVAADVGVGLRDRRADPVWMATTSA